MGSYNKQGFIAFIFLFSVASASYGYYPVPGNHSTYGETVTYTTEPPYTVTEPPYSPTEPPYTVTEPPYTTPTTYIIGPTPTETPYCHNCPPPGYCGDNHIDAGEECDLGKYNGVVGYPCTSDCKKCEVHKGWCGDGKVQPELGEECDPKYDDKCGWDCQWKPVPCCGDKKVDYETGEQCDFGKDINGTPGSSCDKYCKWVKKEPCCGDGIIQDGEQCDDGSLNGTPGSNCTKSCTYCPIEYCGNGITEYGRGEECDDGDMNGKDGSLCTTDCKWRHKCHKCNKAVCGNNYPEGDEECDDGALNGTPESHCTTECKWKKCEPCEKKCGNNIHDDGEQCDDGALNGTEGSNCNADCTLKKNCVGGVCYTCNPIVGFNKCGLSASCIPTMYGDYQCACRAGYRNGGDPNKGQWRLDWPGYEHLVFVKPGVDCYDLCDYPHPGPSSCQEVNVAHCKKP